MKNKQFHPAEKGQKDKQRYKNTTQNLKIYQHEPHRKPGVKSGAPEG